MEIFAQIVLFVAALFRCSISESQVMFQNDRYNPQGTRRNAIPCPDMATSLTTLCSLPYRQITRFS